MVANLFTVTDVSNATALEVVAGGRLYNVVVDNEVSLHLKTKYTTVMYYRSKFPYDVGNK